MSNRLLRDFVEQLDTRYAIESSGMSMAEWVCLNTRLNDKPFSFTRYPFQEQIVSDMHPNMDVIKISQVGLTEVQVRKFLGVLRRYPGVSSIFTLPNEKMFTRVSQTRIRPLVDKDPVFNLAGEEKSIRSKGIIQVGSSFGYVTGCTEGDATSIDADFLFHDELDLSPQDMISLFQSRTQNSDYDVRQKFSTPTHVDYGVDAGFKISDQHEFMVKCDCCGHWQLPDFTREFVTIPGLSDDIEDFADINESIIPLLNLDAATINCRKCYSILDLGRGDNRQWVAKYPERTSRRGYRVRPFSTGRRSVAKILNQLIEYRRNDYIQGWHNTVLGNAYTGANNRLTAAQIKALMEGPGSIDIDPAVPVVLGVDMGLTCHLVLGAVYEDKIVVFYWDTVPERKLREETERLCKAFNVIGGASDRHPYTPLANDVFEITEKKIIPTEYRGTDATRLVEDEFEELSHMQANRTKAIDAVAKGVRKGRYEFVGYGDKKETIINHLRNMVRDEKPGEEAKWIKLSEDDHFFHALALMELGLKYKKLEDFQSDEDTRVGVLIGGVEAKSDPVDSKITTLTKPDNDLALYNRKK